MIVEEVFQPNIKEIYEGHVDYVDALVRSLKRYQKSVAAPEPEGASTSVSPISKGLESSPATKVEIVHMDCWSDQELFEQVLATLKCALFTNELNKESKTTFIHTVCENFPDAIDTCAEAVVYLDTAKEAIRNDHVKEVMDNSSDIDVIFFSLVEHGVHEALKDGFSEGVRRSGRRPYEPTDTEQISKAYEVLARYSPQG